MHVLIDKTNLTFLMRSPNPTMLANFAWLQHSDVSISIQHCSAGRWLRGFTAYEMQKLYENTTGVKPTRYNDQLRIALMALTTHIPEAAADPVELRAQVEAVELNDTTLYVYVPGSKVPMERPDLFDAGGHRIARVDNEDLLIAMGYEKAAEKLYPDADDERFWSGPQAPQPPAPTAGAATERAPRSAGASTLPKGGVRTVIWDVADSQWEMAGKPSDAKVVLKLRKQIMDTLEVSHAINRSTASSELGNWQKNRLPPA